MLSRVLVLLAAIFGAAVLAACASRAIGHPPVYDELLHVLAARGILATGEPVIEEGVYTRAELFTYLVAGAQDVFGDTLVASRIPALVAGLMVVFVAALWIGSRAGVLAGAATAWLLATMPTMIDLAVYTRFYTVHILAVTVTGIAAYGWLVTEARGPRRWLWAVTALSALFLANELQETTKVAALAVAAGLTSVALYQNRMVVVPWVASHRLTSALTFLGIAVIGLLLAWLTGSIDALMGGPLWAQRSGWMPGFYNTAFRTDLPLLWPILPLLAVLAFHRYPRLTIFCATIVGVGLAVQSVAAAKSMRYASYVLPFLCALLGLGMAGAASWLRHQIVRLAPVSQRSASLISVVLLAFVYANSVEGSQALKRVAGKTDPLLGSPFRTAADWRAAADVLSPMAADAESVVVSSGVQALYAFGRYDYELNVSVVGETLSGAEFGRDRRTGKAVIGAVDSLRKVLERPGSELVVAEAAKVGNPVHVSKDAESLLHAECQQVEVPKTSGLRVWWCSN